MLRKTLGKISNTAAFSWAGKGLWAVIDQALFAGTNFLVNILLARWLEPSAYGAFSVAYSLFMLLGTFHTALWTEPMLVYGSGRFRNSFNKYQDILLNYHWRFSALIVLIFLLLAGVSEGAGQRALALGFLGLALAAPSVLYLWLVRRGAYALLQPRLAAAGGALYLALYTGVTLILLKVGLLNETTAFWGMGLAALLAAWVIRGWGSEIKVGQVDPKEVCRLHWAYGRWALLAGALSWLPMNIYFLVLPAVHGLDEVAALKALMNLVMPVLHFNGAIAALFVPVYVRAHHQGALGKVVWVSGAVLTFFALLYQILLVNWGGTLVVLLYGGKYMQESSLLGLLGFLPLIIAWVNTWGAMHRSLERPSLVAFSYLLASFLSVAIGVPFSAHAGLRGAIISMLLIYCTLAAILFILAIKLDASEHGEKA